MTVLDKYNFFSEDLGEQLTKISEWAMTNKVHGEPVKDTLKKYMIASTISQASQDDAELFLQFTKSPLSIIELLLDDSRISDLIITKDGVKAIRGTQQIYKTQINKSFFKYLYNSIQSHASSRISPEEPFINTQIGTARVNMTYNRISRDLEHVIVIRVDQSGIASSDVIDQSIPDDVKRLYENMIDAETGHVFVGITGSGKTTMLRYFLNLKKSNMDNVITIEDVDELKIPGAIGLLTGDAVKTKDLFFNALRQAPTTLVIGEARDEVFLDILEAGLVFPAFTTVHANSFRGFIIRGQIMTREVISSSDFIKIFSESISGVSILRDKKVYQVWSVKDGVAKCEYSLVNKPDDVNLKDLA